METEVNERELSAEELNARKEEMRAFYDDSLPYLNSQCQHEEYLAKIAEARFKRMHYEVQLAMLMSGPVEGNDDGAKTPPQQNLKEDRKLKRK